MASVTGQMSAVAISHPKTCEVWTPEHFKSFDRSGEACKIPSGSCLANAKVARPRFSHDTPVRDTREHYFENHKMMSAKRKCRDRLRRSTKSHDHSASDSDPITRSLPIFDPITRGMYYRACLMHCHKIMSVNTKDQFDTLLFGSVES
jgi:hypothetical protein